MVGSCGSGTSAPSDLQDIKPGQVNIGWCACNVHLKKNSPNFRSSFRCRLRINGTTTMSLFSSEAVLVLKTFEFDPQPWFLLSRLQLPHNALSPYSPCVQDLSHSRGELLQLRCSWTTNYPCFDLCTESLQYVQQSQQKLTFGTSCSLFTMLLYCNKSDS